MTTDGVKQIRRSTRRRFSAVLSEIHDDWLTGRQFQNLARWSEVEESVPERNYRKTVGRTQTCVGDDLAGRLGRFNPLSVVEVDL